MNYTDPMPQALVLTAIVIGFATTALFLVVLLALRGLTGTDHVDGAGGAGRDESTRACAPASSRRSCCRWPTAALMLLLGERRRAAKAALSARRPRCAGLVLAVALLLLGATARTRPAAIGVYLPGNWQAPFGIVLVVDRLSALMLVLTGASAWRRCCSRWRAGTAPACTSIRCSSSS